MNRTGLSIIIVIISAILILFFLLRNQSPFGKNNSSFSIDPKVEISLVTISGNTGNVSIEKNGNDWYLSGRKELRKSAVQYLTTLLHGLSIKSPVSDQMFESEITSKGIKPVRVKVFSNTRIIKSFLVYKTSSNEYGNIMKMRENSKPFIVYVPEFEGNIGTVFTTNELFWLPYNLFNLMPSEISSVEIKNGNDSLSSFAILKKGKRFFLEGDETNKTGWDSTLINRYISYFTWVPFESWALEMTDNERKAIESNRPLFTISVTSNNGKKNTLLLWQRNISERDSVYIDTDRLLGKTGERDELLVIRYFDIDPLIKPRSYFFHK